MWRAIAGICIAIWLLLWADSVQAGPLRERLAQFPDWQSKPRVELAKGDLLYPAWFSGTWEMKSTLLEMIAPLAPSLTTPGFEGNRRYLNHPIVSQVRFQVPQVSSNRQLLPIPTLTRVNTQQVNTQQVVADRAFNGLNLARAYLGDRAVFAVRVDPQDPNRQVTLLRGERQLVSIITGRKTEIPNPDDFIATEVFQQIFRGSPQPYFNEVETTTAYHYQPSASPKIEAEQITALYLSPQDPDYFKAQNKPVALYRYHLELNPATLN